MKGRGLLTLSDRNRQSTCGGSQEEVDSYDHDALSLDDLYEYTPPAQQMQDMGGFFPPPPPQLPPLLPPLPPLELRQVGLPGRDGKTSGLEADSEPRIFDERQVELARDQVPAGEEESALAPGNGTSPPQHEVPAPETEPVDHGQGWGLEESFVSELEIQTLDDEFYVFEDDDASDDAQWLEDFSSLAQESEFGSWAGFRRTSQRNLRYERSQQLAEAYLAKAGLLDEKNLDLLSEVVYHKRWSATQYRVNKLVRAGLSIEQVHAAFELRRVWALLMDSNPVPDYWRRSLSWDGATVLLHSIGDWEVEVDGWHAHFLQSELECWLSKMGRGRWDGHFIDYLLNFRLPDAAHIERVVDPALCIGLDGSHNPLFEKHWFEDWDQMGPPSEGLAYLNVLLGREGRNLY